jgi:hypothetical protein
MNRLSRILVRCLLPALLGACTGTGVGTSVTPAATDATATSGTASTGPGLTIEPDTSPGSIPNPTAQASSPPLEGVELRYKLVDGLGRPLFCDPDFYPVAHDDEAVLAAQHLPAIRADAPTFAAIVAHLRIDPSRALSADQVLAVHREWKMLRSFALTAADGRFAFDYIAAAGSSQDTGFHVTGTIDAGGTITVVMRDPSGPPPCPICLARGTRIATPGGDVLVEQVQPGAAVWTTDSAGRRIVGRVLTIGSTPVPATHEVVHLVLSDGRTVDVSPGHPLPDGRHVGDLRSGDVVDGATVVSAARVAYLGGATFDLLPSGPTGTYWANGILLASTLGP